MSVAVGNRIGVNPLFRSRNCCVTWTLVLFFLSWIGSKPAGAQPSRPAPPRCAMWVDAVEGEPVAFRDMLDELGHATVIYLGEVHSISRHHDSELEVFEGLAKRGTALVLAMEQFEAFNQAVLDRFNSGVLDLNGLIRETKLERRWPGYTNYLPLLRAARSNQAPVLALNARAETIRDIGRHGLATLTPEERGSLAAEIMTNDPLYRKWLNKVLSVHMAFNPNQLDAAFEAQVARDETMAERLAKFLDSPAGQHRTAVVVCGSGHCEYGLGTPARVSRRMPGISQRIVLFSESGDLRLSEEEKKQARTIEVSHDFLRELGRPAGDYFQVTALEGVN